MERIDPDTIADAILAAPGWARVGITAPDGRMRREAAYELGTVITVLLAAGQREPGEEQEEQQARLAL